MSRYAQIGELIKSISKTHKFDKEKLIFLNTSDVLEGKILVNHYSQVSELKGQAKKTIQNGDILYSEIRPKNKRYAFVKNLKNPEDYVVSTKLMVLRNVSSKLNTDYLYHFLTSENSINYLQRKAEGRIGSFPQITFDILKNLNIHLPDLPTQQKIASVLSALDDKIELNNRINAELEAMAKTLYDYWFVQFDFPNAEGKPYKASDGKMVYNEILKREIPEGWEVKTVGDYCRSSGGFAFKSSWWTDNGTPVVKIKDIQEDYTINLSDLAFVDISDKNIDDKFKAKPGDVLIAMTGATVGKYAIVPYTEKPLYVNQRVGYFNLGIKPEKKLPFLINSLNQKYFRESVFTLASGAAQPNISNEQINNIQLLLPSKEIIELYNKVFEPYYSKILLNQKQNQELSSLRDWLLPMLMNGQVKVG